MDTLSLYSIYDRIAEEGGPVFASRNNATAIRTFKGVMQREQLNPADFRLYCVGSWTAQNMAVEGLERPVEVFSGGSEEEQSAAALMGAGG